jgi:acyl-CoA thioesterase FadM
MLLRTLWIFLFKPKKHGSSLYEKTYVQMRVLPIDLDTFMHVNNGVYFSFMDFGRWDHIFKNGIHSAAKKNGWYAVVAGETIRFKKSLKLWNKFTIETILLGNDEKYFYIKQNFIFRNDIMATGLVKVRFLKFTGGTVSANLVSQTLGGEVQDTEKLSMEWQVFDSSFL